MSAAATPLVVVLAGPNGSGKTTCARTLLAETLRLMTFVNADVLAQGLSGFRPESSAFEAGRIMLQRLHSLADQRATFAFETTLAGRSYARFLRSLRQAGYRIHLVYFWLRRADLAVARVAIRVRMGGHAVPEETIRHRYQRSIRNFFRIYRPIASSWEVYDNSQIGIPVSIAQGDETGADTLSNVSVWDEFQKGANRD